MYKLPVRNLIVLRVITCVVIFFTMISALVAGFHVVYIRTPVNGMSMYPTLNSTYELTSERDIVYINRFNKGKVGDMVVLDLRNHINFSDYAIKRLVAIEGDVVNITFDSEHYNLVVNGEIVDSRPNKLLGYNTYSSFLQYIENHKHDETRISKNEGGEIGGVIVKSGEIFVLGDNWEVSKDSSLVGPFNKNTIVGRVDIVIKPTQNKFWTILKRIF